MVYLSTSHKSLTKELMKYMCMSLLIDNTQDLFFFSLYCFYDEVTNCLIIIFCFKDIGLGGVWLYYDVKPGGGGGSVIDTLHHGIFFWVQYDSQRWLTRSDDDETQSECFIRDSDEDYLTQNENEASSDKENKSDVNGDNEETPHSSTLHTALHSFTLMGDPFADHRPATDSAPDESTTPGVVQLTF